MLHVVVEQVTAALEQRSAVHRGRYLARVQQAAEHEPRQRLICRPCLAPCARRRPVSRGNACR